MPATLKLTALSVHNYKSLRNFSMQLASPLTVLVGRNNTGKSSVLDIFEFIKEASINPNDAVKARGAKVSNLLWGNSVDEEAEITLDFDVPDELRDRAVQWLAQKHPTDPKSGTGVVTRLKREDVIKSPFLTTLRYRLRFGKHFLEAISTTDPVNHERQYPLAERAGLRELLVTSWDSRNALWNHSGSEIKLPTQQGPQMHEPETVPMLLFKDYGVKTDSEFAFPWLNAFFQNVYRSSPTRRPDHVRNITSTQVIESDGRNLADVLNSLRNNEEAVFRLIENDLKVLVEGVNGLSTPTSEATTTTRIDETLQTDRNVSFDLKQMSAGTIQLLVLLTQLRTRPDNSLVLLEEVESMLHPHAQADFYRILKSLASRFTILVSTHSPVIASESRTDSLFLLKKKNGETSIHSYGERNIIDEIVEEMGIRPSYNFEANTVVFVEGSFDVAVFQTWLDSLAICRGVPLIDSGGYSKIQFLTNAKILRSKVVRTSVFAVVDGDTRKRGDYQTVKNALSIPKENLLQLEADNLECTLASPAALRRAFPEIEFDEELLKAEPAELKSVFNGILKTVGGYTVGNAAKIAAYVDPPEKWKSFFQTVDAQDRGENR